MVYLYIRAMLRVKRVSFLTRDHRTSTIYYTARGGSGEKLVALSGVPIVMRWWARAYKLTAADDDDDAFSARAGARASNAKLYISQILGNDVAPRHTDIPPPSPQSSIRIPFGCGVYMG